MLTTCLAVLCLLVPPPAEGSIRVATFNASLNRDKAGKLAADLATPNDPQAAAVAEIIQRVRPDILLLNEFDYDPASRSVDLFRKNYLAVGHNGAEPIEYAYFYTAAVNTGVASGIDLDGDGQVSASPGDRAYGNDALGFGAFPGQYGMVLLSRLPIDKDQVRGFGGVLWKDMPGALLPAKPDGSPWYSPAALAKLPLSSKSHWDVPVKIGDRTLHVLVSHPTPPAFDGPEDRNGKRNHDEIRLWADYLTGGEQAKYLGKQLPAEASFVILGDENADPVDGAGLTGGIQQLLDHPRVLGKPAPRSEGAAEAAKLQGEANLQQKGDPAEDTADFADRSVGNLRADYVLPSRDMKILASGVFWPKTDDPLSRLVKMDPTAASSDHRLVYIDVRWPAP